MLVLSLEAIVSISIPLALLIICSENAQATGVLVAQGYNPPNNAMAISGHIGHRCCILRGPCYQHSGAGTAISAAKEVGEKVPDMRQGLAMRHLYILRIICFTYCSFCDRHAERAKIVAVIAGLAMLGVLINSLKTAFSDSKFQMGAFFALIIGMSGVSFFNISVLLWAIIGGLLVSSLIENEHFVLRPKFDMK